VTLYPFTLLPSALADEKRRDREASEASLENFPKSLALDAQRVAGGVQIHWVLERG